MFPESQEDKKGYLAGKGKKKRIDHCEKFLNFVLEILMLNLLIEFYLHTWKGVREQVNRTNWEDHICLLSCLFGGY